MQKPSDSYIEKRIGSRRIFAVEFEIEADRSRPANEWLGCLWLWVQGRCLGESDAVEMVSIGMDALLGAATNTGMRTNPLLSSLPSRQALELVMWAVYGDDDSELEKMAGHRENLYPFDVLPTRAGPFFDGWDAILIEEGATERFIYRREKDSVREAIWKLATFKETIVEAKLQMDKISKFWTS